MMVCSVAFGGCAFLGTLVTHEMARTFFGASERFLSRTSLLSCFVTGLLFVLCQEFVLSNFARALLPDAPGLIFVRPGMRASLIFVNVFSWILVWLANQVSFASRDREEWAKLQISAEIGHSDL